VADRVCSADEGFDVIEVLLPSADGDDVREFCVRLLLGDVASPCGPGLFSGDACAGSGPEHSRPRNLQCSHFIGHSPSKNMH
jgi:hypothetical protein